MTTFPLPLLGEVRLGSGTDVDVRLTDPSVAAWHATLTTGSEMELCDAGSGAATVVGTRRLAPGERCRITPGVVILLGSVTIVVQATGASTRLRHVRSHDYFEGRLDDECVRADTNGGTFTVIRLRFTPDQARAVEESFTRHLRPVDLVAMYAADEYELLLSDTPADKAAIIAAWLADDVRTNGLGELVMGHASWPADGRSPEALLAAAGAGIHGRADVPTSGVPSSGAMEALKPLIERVGQAHINVLILGETGVGKEVLARRIHELSPRAARPLLCVNCAAISESLLESELFGHERGAFTGAVQSKPGLLEVAEGGTVLLDEIGEMPLAIQAKLLRVVEQRSVTRVGGLKARVIDVRFLAATHRDLEAEIERGRFREDLFYRLNGICLTVPPLRERVDEIRPLAQAFAVDSARRVGRPPPRLASGVLAALERYAWPGNVRELKNVMERAVMLSQSDVIDLTHLPLERLGRTLPLGRVSEPGPLGASYPPPAPAGRDASWRPGAYSFAPGAQGDAPVVPHRRQSSSPKDESGAELRERSEHARGGGGAVAQRAAGARPPFLAAAPSFAPAEHTTLPPAEHTTLPPAGRFSSPPDPEEERTRILHALERCAGNQTHAARLLGMSRRTLISRIERYGLPRPRKREP